MKSKRVSVQELQPGNVIRVGIGASDDPWLVVVSTERGKLTLNTPHRAEMQRITVGCGASNTILLELN